VAVFDAFGSFIHRITIPEIRQHTWFNKPLPPPYGQAMTELMAEQDKINQQVSLTQGIHSLLPSTAAAAADD